jgi:hypothetical protein
MPARTQEGRSEVLQRHIAYGDLWPEEDPTVFQLTEDAEDYLSTTSLSIELAEQVDAWPLVPPHEFYDHKPLWGRWPQTSIPALALHGGFDPTMPLPRTSGYEDWLDEPHQNLVYVPLAEHVTLNKGDCPASLYVQFLQGPTEPLDTSCIEEMPPYDWEGEASFNEELLGVADRFGERRCGCQTTSSGSGLLLLVGLLGRRRAERRDRIEEHAEVATSKPRSVARCDEVRSSERPWGSSRRPRPATRSTQATGAMR